MSARTLPAELRSDHIEFALAKRFDWFRNTMATEAVIDGGRADVLFITKSRYVTEIEIKISMSDWNADRHKDKWTKPRPHIKRFFYAVPRPLADKIPEWVPQHVGVIACHGLHTTIVRDARAMKAKPVTPEFVHELHESMYYRFWHARMNVRRERFYIEAQRRALREERAIPRTTEAALAAFPA